VSLNRALRLSAPVTGSQVCAKAIDEKSVKSGIVKSFERYKIELRDRYLMFFDEAFRLVLNLLSYKKLVLPT
jgi:hypothetical protein